MTLGLGLERNDCLLCGARTLPSLRLSLQTARTLRTPVARGPVPSIRRSLRAQPLTRLQAAITMPAGSQVSELSDEERAAYAKETGYLKVGKTLPSNVTLTDIIKSMPAEVSVLRWLYADFWGRVGGHVGSPNCPSCPTPISRTGV